ncbi:MAG: hypothetical protein R2797_07515 [Gelidibacter sp.]
MTTSIKTKPSVGFWIASVVALLWNLMGVNAYIQQVYNTPEFRTNFSEQQLAIMDAQPAWATAAFAIAVFAGALGCVLLLFRKKFAKILFIISLLAIIVQFSHELFMTNASEFYDSFAWIMTIMIPVVAIFLIWLSNKAIAKHWIA